MAIIYVSVLLVCKYDSALLIKSETKMKVKRPGVNTLSIYSFILESLSSGNVYDTQLCFLYLCQHGEVKLVSVVMLFS